jgi:hypothetical protein
MIGLALPPTPEELAEHLKFLAADDVEPSPFPKSWTRVSHTSYPRETWNQKN